MSGTPDAPHDPARKPARRAVRSGAASADAPRPDDGRWYAEGLRFECTACGKCCVNHGDGYEYVYSTRAERVALAAHFGLSLRAFEARYCERAGGDLSFRSERGGCVFLEGGRCSVYSLRPAQCRTFPFWPELIASERVWKKDVEAFCPGAGTGPLHSAEEIEAVARRSHG